jgi:hypothetical protein
MLIRVIVAGDIRVIGLDWGVDIGVMVFYPSLSLSKIHNNGATMYLATRPKSPQCIAANK